MASDAFFPFPDGLEEAVKSGIDSRDSARKDEVRPCRCDGARGPARLAMVFTGSAASRY